MAAEQTLSGILESLVDAALRKTDPSFRHLCGLAGLDPARDFAGAVLVEMDFRNEDLTGFSFRDADLMFSDFTGAVVDDGAFEGANLLGVTGLDLEGDHHGRGVAAFNAGQLDLAEHYFRLALDHAERVGSAYATATECHWLSEVFRERRVLSEATDWARKAITHREAAHAPEALAEDWAALGDILVLRRRKRETVEAYAAAYDLLVLLGDELRIGAFCLSVAGNLRNSGQSVVALQYAVEATRRLKFRDAEDLPKAADLLVDIYADLGRIVSRHQLMSGESGNQDVEFGLALSPAYWPHPTQPDDDPEDVALPEGRDESA
jgi:tetratricopeptide (TPR) repeat protein